MNNDIQCNCGEWHEINHDDGYGWKEGKHHFQHCHACDMYFCYTIDYELVKPEDIDQQE